MKLLSLFVVMPTLVASTYVHPIWGPVNSPEVNTQQPTSPRSSRSLGQYIAEPLSSHQQSTRNESMKERVCKRVKNRFSDDLEVMEKINGRLQDRFGFTCTVISLIPPTGDLSRSDVDEGFGGARIDVVLNTFGPVGDNIPRGAQGVHMLKMDLTASCVRDIALDSIIVTDNGPGLASDVTGLWISIDGRRISRPHALSSDKTVQLRFQRPLIIGGCKTVTLDIHAKFSETALSNSKHTIGIRLPEDIVSDSDVAGDFPVFGKRFNVSTYRTGKIKVSHLPVLEDVIIDASDDQIIGKFSLSVDDSEDQTLQSVTLENTGNSHDGDIVGIYLRGVHGRARFTELEPHTEDDHVTLFFDPPYPLLEGRSMDFEVIANAVNGTGSSVRMRVEEPVDVIGIGSRSGFGRNGQKYGAHVEIEGVAASNVRMR